MKLYYTHKGINMRYEKALQGSIEILNSMDLKDPIQQKKIEETYAHLMEVETAQILGHQFVDAQGYDAISKSGKKYEYKTCIRCEWNSLTINNVKGKRDIILRLGPGINGQEMWFLFPEHIIKNTQKPDGSCSFMKGEGDTSYLKLPKNPFLKTKDGQWSRDSWVKQLMRQCYIELDQLIRITND